MANKAIIVPPVPKGAEKVHVRKDTSKRSSTLTTARTTVSTTAIKIETPAEANNLIIRHEDPSVIVYIGPNDSITADGSNTWPLYYNEELKLEQFQLDNENSIYAITESGSVTMYCLGFYLT